MPSTKKMCLEEYLRFLHSDREGLYTVGFLNQIVGMHGFRKVRFKKQVSDAVKTIELTDPARSTLKEKVSSNAFLELDEVVADLDAIKWKECCLSGIQTLSSKPDSREDPDLNITISNLHDTTTTRVRKSKSRPIDPAQEENSDVQNATTATGDGTSPSAASTTINAPPPSKKSKKFSAPLKGSSK